MKKPAQIALSGFSNWCLEPESNRHDPLRSADFKSAVSTDFTIEAQHLLSLMFCGVLARRGLRQ